MKYVVEHKQETMKLMYYNVKMDGLDVNPKNNVKGLSIKAQKISIIDPLLTQEYIKQRINRKIDKIIKFMLRILSEEGTTDDDTGMVLDEINRLKGIIINKYKKYIKDEEYKGLMSKLIIIEEEFKRNYNQKMFRNYVNNYYVEENINGRGR